MKKAFLAVPVFCAFMLAVVPASFAGEEDMKKKEMKEDAMPMKEGGMKMDKEHEHMKNMPMEKQEKSEKKKDHMHDKMMQEKK